MKTRRGLQNALAFLMGLLLVALLLPALTHAMDVTLAWDPNKEPDLAGYNIYWSTDPAIPSANRTKINIPLTASGFVPGSPQWTIKNLTDTQTVYFAATAYDNETPTKESGYSNIVSANYADIFKGIPPGAPGTLRPTSVTTTVSKTTTTITNKVALYGK